MLTVTRRDFTLADGSKGWTWQIKGTCPYTGELIRVGTRTRDRKVAEDRLRILLEERRELALKGDRIAHNFAAGVLEYLAKGGEQRYVAPLLDHFGKWLLKDIKDADLSAYCSAVYPDAKPSTLIRHVYGPMQWILNAASRAELCEPRTFQKPKTSRTPAKYARTDDWLQRVLADGCTNHVQRCALLFMSFSGARASEVVNVLVRDYHADTGFIALGRTKNGKERLVPLPPFVNEALRQLAPPGRDESERLFGYASRYSLNRILKRACDRAGVEYLSPHRAGRHTFAARLLRSGASLKELQQAGGWDDLGVVARSYAHLERNMVDARVRNVQTTVNMDQLRTIKDTMPSGPDSPIVPFRKKTKG